MVIVSNPETVPQQLKQLSQWFHWREEPNQKGKPTKVPYVAGNGRYASSTNSATWTDFETAKKTLTDGRGLAFAIENTGIVFIDIDHCRDAATGEILPPASQIVKELNSYTEISPSGTGLHIFVRATFPEGRNENKKDFPEGYRFEIYASGRYSTITGHHLAGTPADVMERDVTPIYERMFGKVQPKPSLLVSTPKLDLKAFLFRNNIAILKEKSDGSGTVYEIECHGSHEGYDKCDGKAFVKQFTSGALSYGCQHKTCSHSAELGNHWQELRARYESFALPKKPTTKRKKWLSHAELKAEVARKPHPEIVEGLLTEHSANVCVGESSIGKTPLVLQIALCVSQGISFLGMPTKRLRVLLVDYENTEYELDKMLEALCLYLNVESPIDSEWLHILHYPESQADVFEEVVQFQPGLLIVDALRGFDPQAEKGNPETAQLFNALRGYETTWLFIHHPRKEDKDEDKAVPLKDAKRVVDWLQQASGARGIINQSMVRIAVDSIHSENGGDLLMRWNFKGRGDFGPMIIGRQLDEEGEPLGYYRVTGIELLKTEYRPWFVELLNNREQTEPMRRVEIIGKLKTTPKKADSFIRDCINCGLVSKAGQARTKTALYTFHIGGDVNFPT